MVCQADTLDNEISSLQTRKPVQISSSLNRWEYEKTIWLYRQIVVHLPRTERGARGLGSSIGRRGDILVARLWNISAASVQI